MKNVVFQIFLLTFFSYCHGQNKIDILVNRENINITAESIRVNTDDSIDIQIYSSDLKLIKFLVDSIRVEGCGIYNYQKKRLIPPPKNSVEQQSATKTLEKKFITHKIFKPRIKGNYIDFNFALRDVTACPGRNFFVELIFDPKKSTVNSFKNFLSKYKFYYIL